MNSHDKRFIRNAVKFISWSRWNPDLFFDLITPEMGGIRLDLDQRVFLRAVSRFTSTYGVFPRGYGKCISGDSILYTKDGMKEISEYFNYNQSNQEIYVSQNINLLNRYGKSELSHTGVYSGYQPTKKIITEEGYEIEGTHNHPVLVMNDEGKIVWKQLEEIQIGDYLAINRNNDIWGTNTKLNIDMDSFLNKRKKNLKIYNISNLTLLNEDLALILGYLVGDGGLTQNNVITFTNTDEDLIKNYVKFMQNKLGVKVSKQNIDYKVFGIFMREVFRQLGLKQTNAFGKEVPKIILESPKNIVSAFIKGLFDTDGTVAKSYVGFTTASEKLSKQVQISLLNFGIISARQIKQDKKYKTMHYTIYIYGGNIDLYHKNIGFSCKRKQSQLEKIININRNTNKNIIPFQRDMIKRFYNDAKKYNTYLYDKLYHVLKGNNELTYQKLSYLLNLNNLEKCNGYTELTELHNLNYFYSKVKKIENNQNHVYDLSLPNTNSFISNGFISHNTFLEVMSLYHTATFFPEIDLSLTAQTRENASKLLAEKHLELMRFYPLLKNELDGKPRFGQDYAEIKFKSGGRIDVLANNQSSKGARRKRINIEESALLNNTLFEDVLEPVVNIPRRTIGKAGVVNPEELNSMLNFFSTSGFRGTDEFDRNIRMLNEMADLKGSFVLGSDWQLAIQYGRGEPKGRILDKKEKLSPTSFARNYESKWVGASDGQLVSVNKLLDLRTLSKPELVGDDRHEYVIAMDVARSQSGANNQSSIAVLKFMRNRNMKVINVQLVNLINLPNGLTFTAQTSELKKIQKLYDENAKVVIDGNGLGELLPLCMATYKSKLGEPVNAGCVA